MKTFVPLTTTYPGFVQPKLNGVGFTFTTDRYFRSRTNKYFPAVQQLIQHTWPVAPEYPLLGEFFHPEISLQEIAGAVGADSPNDICKRLQFWIYDCVIPHRDQAQRFTWLFNPGHAFWQWERFVKTPTHEVRDTSEVNDYYDLFLSQSYEGLIYRPYYAGEPTKLKPFFDEEYTCIGVNEGVGKRAGHVGAFLVQDKDGRTFEVGGGQISYSQLAAFLLNPPIGKQLTCRYNAKTKDGIPQGAQFICVRDPNL